MKIYKVGLTAFIVDLIASLAIKRPVISDKGSAPFVQMAVTNGLDHLNVI